MKRKSFMTLILLEDELQQGKLLNEYAIVQQRSRPAEQQKGLAKQEVKRFVQDDEIELLDDFNWQNTASIFLIIHTKLNKGQVSWQKS